MLNSGCAPKDPKCGTRPDTTPNPRHPESRHPESSEPGPTPSNRYIFTEVLAPALLAGLLLWYTLADVLALIGRVAEAVLVYIKAGAVAFVETVEHYASKLHS